MNAVQIGCYQCQSDIQSPKSKLAKYSCSAKAVAAAAVVAIVTAPRASSWEMSNKIKSKIYVNNHACYVPENCSILTCKTNFINNKSMAEAKIDDTIAIGGATVDDDSDDNGDAKYASQ